MQAVSRWQCLFQSTHILIYLFYFSLHLQIQRGSKHLWCLGGHEGPLQGLGTNFLGRPNYFVCGRCGGSISAIEPVTDWVQQEEG